MNAISNRGGKRQGAGRKANPAKQLNLAQATAERILRELNYEKEIVELYRTCGDARLKAQILFRLDQRANPEPRPEDAKAPSNIVVTVRTVGQ